MERLLLCHDLLVKTRAPSAGDQLMLEVDVAMSYGGSGWSGSGCVTQREWLCYTGIKIIYKMDIIILNCSKNLPENYLPSTSLHQRKSIFCQIILKER